MYDHKNRETWTNLPREEMGDQVMSWLQPLPGILQVSEVNTSLSSGQFQNDGVVVQPSLDFLERFGKYSAPRIRSGVELGENGIPKRNSKLHSPSLNR